VKITSSVEVSLDKRDQFLAAVSKAVADVTGKPERYMMVVLDSGAIAMGGKIGPSAFVDVRAIGGLTPQVNAKLSAQICALILKWLNVPGERVYLTFIDIPASHWGSNGATFG
jgi:phenylpyruvate tautomerase PptA (4-oxalocrotonate tautomerase family)